MYIRLNLASNPLISHRRFLVGAALVGLFGSVLFVLLGLHFYKVRKVDADYRARAGKVQDEMSRLLDQRHELERFFAKEENRNLQDRAKFINNLIEARSFNWTKMFMDLERTLPAGVRVVRIEPRLDRGMVTVRFVVGASSQDAKQKMLDAFEASPSFTHVELFSETVPKQASSDALTVEFSAIYTGI